MRLPHYLGGLENLGPVNFFDKKVFMAEWEKRIFGIHTVMMAESSHLANALPKYPIADVPTIVPASTAAGGGPMVPKCGRICPAPCRPRARPWKGALGPPPRART